MLFSWRMARRATFGILALTVCAGLVAWCWPNPSYNVNRVHPVIRELREPFRDVGASYYLDGGSISVRIVDADGRELSLVFLVKEEPLGDGRVISSYERMSVGDINDPNRVELPFTQDSMNRAIEIVDEFRLTYAKEDFERMSTLQSYRHYPRDAMRAIWLRLWCDLD